MNVFRKVTGYDRRTERLTFEFDLTDEDLPDLDDTALHSSGAVPLGRDIVARVAYRRSVSSDVADRCDWFVEPFAAEQAIAST